MLSRAGQCGLDTAKVGTFEVEAAATMDRPPGYEHRDMCEGELYNASSLNLHGILYDYASFNTKDLPA